MRLLSMSILAVAIAVGSAGCDVAGEEGGQGGGGGSGPDGNGSEQEIASEGGALWIVDEYGNTIEVTFPKDALAGPTRVTLALVPDRADLLIETRHATAFEIRPHDLQLYRPVSVVVRYANPVADIETALLVRETSDQLLIPLANHAYIQSPSGEGEATRASMYVAGVFAEGTMSLEQVDRHLNALLDSRGISLEQVLVASSAKACDTHITKAIWDASKEAATGVEELTRVGREMELGLYPDEEVVAQSVCEQVVAASAGLVLERCVPADICDRDYQYVVSEVLPEVQRCGALDGELHDELYRRFEEIQIECIKQGTLQIEFLGEEVVHYDDPPNTPFISTLTFNLDAVIPLRIEVFDANGVADVSDDDIDGRTTILHPFKASGSIVYWPGSLHERSCTQTATGFLRVKVAGLLGTARNFSLAILTYHHHDYVISCPNLPDVTLPLRHVKNSVFEVELDQGNGYAARTTAKSDPQWEVDADLLLPESFFAGSSVPP